jgi:protease-4
VTQSANSAVPSQAPPQKGLFQKRPLLVSFIIIVFVVVLFTIILLSLSFVSRHRATGISWADKVGVIKVEGIIMDSREVIEQLHRYKKSGSVKAVVIRVDSPGGAVGPAQEIFEEVKKLADKKPVVVSMGSVSASGGYYISAPASWLVANPGTLTGSIGVVMEFVNIQDLMQWMKIKHNALKSGDMKDMGSPYRDMTQKEREHLQKVIDDVHLQFEQAVAEGRKMDPEKVHELADGRIFTGRQALEMGLVDELGNLHDAIKKAAEMAGIKGEPTVIWPPKTRHRLIDRLLDSIFQEAWNELAPYRYGLFYLWKQN